MKQVYLITLALVLCLIHAGSVLANKAQNLVNIATQVMAVCIIQNIESINFGTYDITAGPPKVAQGNVQVTCSKNTPYTIFIDDSRQMRRNSDILNYELYANASHTKIWGNTAETGEKFISSGIESVTIPIFGLIPALQTVSPGTYTNVNIITIEW